MFSWYKGVLTFCQCVKACVCVWNLVKDPVCKHVINLYISHWRSLIHDFKAKVIMTWLFFFSFFFLHVAEENILQLKWKGETVINASFRAD